jgi:hypothetical protein
VANAFALIQRLCFGFLFKSPGISHADTQSGAKQLLGNRNACGSTTHNTEIDSQHFCGSEFPQIFNHDRLPYQSNELAGVNRSLADNLQDLFSRMYR